MKMRRKKLHPIVAYTLKAETQAHCKNQKVNLLVKEKIKPLFET